MTTNQFPFKVLFCFENESLLVVEIKRTDIQSEDKSLVYKWLKIQKQPNNEGLITQLTFQSMEQANTEQIRNFAEGTLRWNAHSADFNGQELKQVEPEEVHKEWMEVIARTI